MPLDTQELMSAISIITDEHNMRVTLKQSTKGAMLAGGFCFVGGLLAGPVGLAIGGAIGGLTAANVCSNFKSVSQVINEDLTVAQREELKIRVERALRSIDATDVALLLPLLLNSEAAKVAVMREVANYLTSQMRMQIVD
uniref:Uncharacterized protein n=1 Tax=Corethrella appendiculata TaxID=1370023 RepID=U5EZ00_9DIPT